MRLFLAIDLDEAARQAVAAEQRRVARAIQGADRSALRWVAPERLHFTLVFLGDVTDAQMPPFVAVVNDRLDARPFVARLTGLGVFPRRGAPKVLWIGVGEGAQEIADLQRRATGLTMRAGIPVEAQPFRPHLTLARWRTSRPIDARRVLAADGHLEVAQVEVDHITLYHSQLSAAGPTYTALARATLTPCRPSSSPRTS
jgi:2'-5' RNA ligase